MDRVKQEIYYPTADEHRFYRVVTDIVTALLQNYACQGDIEVTAPIEWTHGQKKIFTCHGPISVVSTARSTKTISVRFS